MKLFYKGKLLRNNKILLNDKGNPVLTANTINIVIESLIKYNNKLKTGLFLPYILHKGVILYVNYDKRIATNYLVNPHATDKKDIYIFEGITKDNFLIKEYKVPYTDVTYKVVMREDSNEEETYKLIREITYKESITYKDKKKRFDIIHHKDKYNKRLLHDINISKDRKFIKFRQGIYIHTLYVPAIISGEVNVDKKTYNKISIKGYEIVLDIEKQIVKYIKDIRGVL